jgi:hypothetical protein
MSTPGLTWSGSATFVDAVIIVDDDGHGESAANPCGLARPILTPSTT